MVTPPPLHKSLTYYEQIYQKIKELIFQGVYKPGERLYEARLAKEYNLSRSPVREAVRTLITEGLLVIDERSHLRIYRSTIEDVEDIYQCRMVLETLAVKLTTSRASEEELAKLEDTLVRTEQAINQGKPIDEIIHLNSQFHDQITEYSKNKRLQIQLENLRSLSYYCRIMNFQGKNRDLFILEDHKSVFKSIKARDIKQAEIAMHKHIENDLSHLKIILAT